jgi:hypothetical protein
VQAVAVGVGQVHGEAFGRAVSNAQTASFAAFNGNFNITFCWHLVLLRFKYYCILSAQKKQGFAVKKLNSLRFFPVLMNLESRKHRDISAFPVFDLLKEA